MEVYREEEGVGDPALLRGGGVDEDGVVRCEMEVYELWRERSAVEDDSGDLQCEGTLLEQDDNV